MIPAGLAPLSVVFIGFQTSILCFPHEIFFQAFIQSKIHLKAFFFFFKGKTLKFNMIIAYAD